MRVFDLMLPRLQMWDFCKVAKLFNTRESVLILSIPLSHRVVVDAWVWLREKSSLYTIKKRCKLIQSRLDIQTIVSDRLSAWQNL